MVKKKTKKALELSKLKFKNWEIYDIRDDEDMTWIHKRRREEVSVFKYDNKQWYIFLPSPWSKRFIKPFGEYKVNSQSEAYKLAVKYMRGH